MLRDIQGKGSFAHAWACSDDDQIRLLEATGLRVEIVDQIARQDTFNRRLRADGHKDRSLDIPMCGVENAGARSSVGAGGLEGEVEHAVRTPPAFTLRCEPQLPAACPAP